MIRIDSADYSEIKIQREEVLYYMNAGKNAEESVFCMADDAVLKIKTDLSCRACFDIFDIKRDDNKLDFGFFNTDSVNLRKNLENCGRVILFAATVGFGVDRLITKYSSVSPVTALSIQAAGAAAIEAWCDLLCEKFKTLDEANGKTLKPRFSPGYGDLPLDIQSDILSVLDSGRKAGITMTDGFLMLPTKSVTAFVGICDE